ncbi:hypothetical protein D3C80_995220 [compost metagenome]
MLQCAVDRFIHIAIAIGLSKATIITVGHHVKAFGIGVITRKRHTGVITQGLLGATAVVLITMRPNTRIQRRAVLRTRSDNVHHAANGIRTINSRTWSADILDTLYHRDRELAEIRRARHTRLVKTNTINQNEYVAGVGTTDKERRGLSHSAVLRGIHARQSTHHVKDSC